MALLCRLKSVKKKILICPKCKYDYVEGKKICPDCNVKLEEIQIDVNDKRYYSR